MQIGEVIAKVDLAMQIGEVIAPVDLVMQIGEVIAKVDLAMQITEVFVAGDGFSDPRSKQPIPPEVDVPLIMQVDVVLIT